MKQERTIEQAEADEQLADKIKRILATANDEEEHMSVNDFMTMMKQAHEHEVDALTKVAVTQRVCALLLALGYVTAATALVVTGNIMWAWVPLVFLVGMVIR